MDVVILQLTPKRVVMLRHTGPYDTIGPVFEQLWGWVSSHGVPVNGMIGIYWDNPDFVEASQLRSAACVEVPPTFNIADRDGLDLQIDHIAGGPYAMTRYVGPYEGLGPVWTEFTNHIERNLRRQISDNPAFELYKNDPSETPPDQLITELYMPVV